MEGQILAGRYLVGETLGTGGMGSVFRATDLRTGGFVAVKVPHPWLTIDVNYVARLHREAQIAASLNSPRVVKVMDFDWHEGRPFLVMEYVPGPTLADVLAARHTLTWPEAGHVALGVARALDAAQKGGIVHRDLKPQNIKVVDDDVKVLDFGIARAASLPAVTATGAMVGTPQYMAPERLGDSDRVPTADTPASNDVRSDIYSLGVIMYEMLAGRPPFQGATYWVVLRGHLSEPPPPLPDTVPAAVQQIVFRCLEKDPDKRFQAPGQLAMALRSLAIAQPAEVDSFPDVQTTSVAAGAGPASDAAPHPAPVRDEPLARPPSDEITLYQTLPALNVMNPVQAATTLGTESPTLRSPGTARAAKRRSMVAPLLALGGLGVAVALGAGAVIAANRGGTTPAGAPARGSATQSATPAAETPSPTPLPTAAPVRVSDITVYRSGAEFLSGAAPVSDLLAGEGIFLCYGYQGAGNGTLLTVVAIGPEGAASAAATEPYAPVKEEDLRCEALPGAADLAPGQYALVVQDRGDERARQNVRLAAPPPPPTPEPAPSTPVQQPAPQRQPTVVQPAQTAPPPTVVRTQAPLPPSPTQPPPPPPTQPPSTEPPATAPPATPPPGRTAVPGR